MNYLPWFGCRMDSRAYFGALLLNKHCASLLSSEQRRLERQRKLMYNKVWKEKELLMDDYIHINVRTPSPQRTSSSLTASAGRGRFDSASSSSSAVASRGVQNRGSTSSMANSRAPSAVSDPRRVGRSSPSSVGGSQRHASSAVDHRRSAQASSTTPRKKLHRSVSSAAAFERDGGKSLAPTTSSKASGATAVTWGHPEPLGHRPATASSGVRRPPSADSVSGCLAAPHHNNNNGIKRTVTSPSSDSVSSPHGANRHAASVTAPHNNNNIIIKQTRPCSDSVSSLYGDNRHAVSVTAPHNSNHVEQAVTSPSSDSLSSLYGANRHAASVTAPHNNNNDIEQTRPSSDSDSDRSSSRGGADDAERTLSRVSWDKTKDSCHYRGHHRDKDLDLQPPPSHVTTKGHGEERASKLNDRNNEGYEDEPPHPHPHPHPHAHPHRPQTHGKAHVRQMTLDPKLVLPLTAKRYQCSKQATIIPVITVYGRQATLYPNAEAKVGRVVTMDRRTRGWIERSTSILSLLEDIRYRPPHRHRSRDRGRGLPAASSPARVPVPAETSQPGVTGRQFADVDPLPPSSSLGKAASEGDDFSAALTSVKKASNHNSPETASFQPAMSQFSRSDVLNFHPDRDDDDDDGDDDDDDDSNSDVVLVPQTIHKDPEAIALRAKLQDTKHKASGDWNKRRPNQRKGPWKGFPFASSIKPARRY